MAGIYAIGLALVCTCGACGLALWHIYHHLCNYTEPTYQRYTVRIIFMIPVYALMSFLALVMPQKAIIFNSICGIYEAWVIYNFLSLCLAWVGGPGAVVTSLHGRLLKPSWHLMTCCCDAIPLDGRFIRRCKQGVLQFVILKPILVLAAFVLFYYHLYEDGSFSASGGYLYITLIYTLSYTGALGALVLFYVACKDLLRPFRPLPKFVLIKSVVFLTYWQGLGVFLLSEAGVIKSSDEAADVQNILICVEMLAAAVAHLFAFPYKDYAEANVGVQGGLVNSIFHALNITDVVYDTMHQFAPTYHEYVLYSDGSQEAPKRYRARTFVPTGQEMETLRKAKNPYFSNKLDDSANSPGVSSSEGSSPTAELGKKGLKVGGSGDVMGGPLLFDAQSAQPYDMSPLDVPGAHYRTIDMGLPPQPRGQRKDSVEFNPRMPSAQVQERSQHDSRWLSGQDNRRNTEQDSRRSSTGEDALETTKLTTRRPSSQGSLIRDIDLSGENEEYSEGFIQR